jgi:hypothetical protein
MFYKLKDILNKKHTDLRSVLKDASTKFGIATSTIHLRSEVNRKANCRALQLYVHLQPICNS